MVVTATYASNETKELSGYTTEPEAGDKLTIAANNEKPVEVSYGGMTAKTDNLTVSAKIVEKPEATGYPIFMMELSRRSPLLAATAITTRLRVRPPEPTLVAMKQLLL